ncbi:MAG: hypothetical protein ABI599_18180 [Flavobacteriales bacterium]
MSWSPWGRCSLAGKTMIGYALDRSGYRTTSTSSYTGKQVQGKHVALMHSVELAIGPSLLVALKKRTVMLDLVGTLAYGSTVDGSGSDPALAMRAVMVSVGYWWGRSGPQ